MEILNLISISKNYGGVKALSNINLTIEAGEIHSIIGENGAGKSTLMKIISGVIFPSEGQLYVNKQAISFKNTREAENQGIFIIHQEPIFFPELTTLENIFIGRELTNSIGVIDWNAMNIEATKLLLQMGLDINILNIPMGELSIGTQQMVLIIKGVYRESKLLILDEPTSILSFDESQKLFNIIKKLAARNVSILYISHRIAEVLELSDKITVLKDGVLIQSIAKDQTNADHLLELMSGYQVNKEHTVLNNVCEEVIFSVNNCSSPNAFENISFDLKRGQILGMYGLIGAGRTELAQAIIGERKYTGEMSFKSKKFMVKNAKEAYNHKIIYLPEDRIIQGVFSIDSIKHNMLAGLLNNLCGTRGIYSKNKEQDIVANSIDTYSIKVNHMDDRISSLSGGNQQKVLLTRCLLHKPEILILDEPTRGIDIKTKIEIYKLIISLVQKNISVILISSDLTEMLSLTNTVYVMHEGKYVDFLADDLCTEENILKAALGT